MARPREFDRERVLERAIETFWQRGYERTTVSDLVDSMGIQRGSLYAAFGDKRALFLEALDRYEEHFHETMLAALETGPAPTGIRKVFQQVLDDCACIGGSRGCLITNTAVALAEGDEETASRVRSNLRRMEDTFARALAPAIDRGEVSSRHDPRALGRFLTNSLQGLRVLSKCGVEIDVLRDAVELTLSVLDHTIKKGDPTHG